jgi:hypothetical protein
MKAEDKVLIGGVLVFAAFMIFLGGTYAGGAMDRYASSSAIIDRKLVAAQLDNLSDWVGFQSRFVAAGKNGKILVMNGGDLCGTDFLQTLPPAFKRMVIDNGFEAFACWDGARLIIVEVKP